VTEPTVTDLTGPGLVAADPLAADHDWRRLDPRMLLVHPVNEVVRFLPALIGVFLIGNSLDGDRWWHVAAVAVPVALGLLRYATTSYRIAAGQLQLRRGLVVRTQLTAHLDRIRTVELTAPPIHRMLGLAKVEIGTAGGGQGGNERIRLDSLALPQARALRAALLHRVLAVDIPSSAAGSSYGDGTAAAPTPTPAPIQDEVLLRLNPRWIRYAPLTTSGLVVAAAVAGAASQFAGPLVGRLIHDTHFDTGSQVALLVLAAVLAFVVLISLLSLIGYLLSYWGFVLSRDGAHRSFHVSRGLATSRETSVDVARVRGVELHEPLGLRLTGGARLSAIVTGMSRREAGVAPMVPPAPRSESVRVGALVIGGAGPLEMPLVAHGGRAVRRRYQRALALAVLLAAAWTLLVLAEGWSPWLLLAGVAPTVAAVPLAADRAARLGHALTPEFLITRAHSLRGRRDVLLRDGIIGWNIHQTFFQRRAGLVTLTATTAAGRQGYRVHDVPEQVAVALADAAVPGLLTPFLAPAETAGVRQRPGRARRDRRPY
jgi:putative membrane protein